MDSFMPTHLTMQIEWTYSIKDALWPKFMEEEIDNLNKSISLKEMELITNNLSKQEAQGPDGFIADFCQTLKEEIIPIIYIFQKIEAEGICLN